MIYNQRNLIRIEASEKLYIYIYIVEITKKLDISIIEISNY